MLVTLLSKAIDSEWVVTPQLALAICNAARELPTLVDRSSISRIAPQWRSDCVFALEFIEDIEDEIKPLHLAHWKETEKHRHDLPFQPDYKTFIRYERAGRYALFTLRINGRLLGNCAMYLDMSAHTQTLIATEDTLYLLPEARKGRRAMKFVRYIEDSLKQLGVKEISVTVKTVNKAERFFRMNGYSHVENGLTKILEDQNV
jgi:N-acetylglutamate synthase-like GNAT family acetyltransferase